MKKKEVKKKIIRDISWLAFNERVLQEAKDISVSIPDRLRFLGIFSNNLDEFFRVRVATLNRMEQFGKQAKMYLENKPALILKQIQQVVLEQQKDFGDIYENILTEMKKIKIRIVNEKQLSKQQKEYVTTYFNEKVRTNLSPLMIESISDLPLLHDKSIYLACVLSNTQNSFMNSYSLIEVPTHALPRFVILPDYKGDKCIILLEDIIRFCLPNLFTQFGFNHFEGYIIKVTRDAELDMDNDVNSNFIQSIETGLKNRKKGRAVRLVYDKTIQKNLLDYLIKLLNLSKKDHLIPGGRIHNFKDFMDFPSHIFHKRPIRKKPFVHPLLTQPVRILDVLNTTDIMLHFPYHSFDSIIDLLREAAIDPYVQSIKVTCYRLAKDSKIISALINAHRNGKQVTAVLELKARFDEEANIKWKKILEEEGVKVLVGLPDRKIHAKLCLITKRVGTQIKKYGFVSTGNLNEQTANVYGDHCLLTSNRNITNDIANIFKFFQTPLNTQLLKKCKTIITSPINTRSYFLQKIKNEIKNKKNNGTGKMIIKLNSLTDEQLINEIYNAAAENCDIDLIIRGICTLMTENKQWKKNIHAISIVDQYLEHARIQYFYNAGKEEVYISSADWMMRNLDYRIEATTPIFDTAIKDELKTILHIQLTENEKARILNNKQDNIYVKKLINEKSVRSQVEIYNYLFAKKYILEK